MKSYFLFLILFIYNVTCSELWSQTTNSRGNLVWFDEFEGSGVPDPGKWDRQEYNRRANSNGPDGWWSKEDSYLDGKGNLVIRVRKIPNRNNDDDAYDYSCGALRTKGKFEQLHGIFEIRCQLPTQQGWWVAFWMMQGNVNSTANGGVDGSEVDIMEGFGWTDKINQAIHWDGYGDAHKSTGHKEEIEGIREGYHTYSMEWHPNEYIFYIDGVETWRTTGGGVCNQPGYLKITGEISTLPNLANQYWANDPEFAAYPDSFLVDYVRVYEFAEDNIETPIRSLVESCFPDSNLVVGSACHEWYLGTQTEEILNREFHYVTPANDFKQSYVHPQPGVWKWERSDIWVDHCRKNNQVIRLHAPISPQCSPWAKTDSRTAAELEQNLTEFMTGLCKRYNDSTHIKWLDVVNETVSTDGSWFGPKPGTDKWENPWPKIGYDESHSLRPPIYIKKAFEIANEHGSNFKLIINQHGGMEDAMWNKIKALVPYLRENGLRIDGIGWQAHLWMGWEKVAGNMEKLEALIDWCHANDLEFHITEFNVWLKPGDMQKKSEQANTFYEITKLAASKHKSGFVGINYWHIRGVETANKDRDGCPWAENYEPKESVFRIKDAICRASEICNGNCSTEKLTLHIDSFSTGENMNLLGGEWIGFSDENSTHSLSLYEENAYQNSPSAKFDWERKKGAVIFPYAGFQTYLSEQKTPLDISDYFAIKFQCKGSGLINVGLITASSLAEGNHFYSEIVLKNVWTNVEIPFDDLKQTGGIVSAIDPDSVIAIIFMGSGNFNEPGELWLDNVQFISENLLSPVVPPEPKNPILSHHPKTNQLGYLPAAKKYFSIVADSVSSGQEFFILDENNQSVFSGNLSSSVFNDEEISGEQLYIGDFSIFSASGNFKIQVGEKNSHPFVIHEEVFDSTLFNSLRFFYLARANHEKKDGLTGLTHGYAHQEEFNLSEGIENNIDVSGGWYNAADYGKYVPFTAFAAEHLLNLFEANSNFFRLQNLQIPESENNIPDLLDEVKIGLSWLLKMQREDGSVFHKVDSEPNFAYGYGPDEDPHTRKISDSENFSTIDAAYFTAVMAHASRVFQAYDSTFAMSCKNAALLSWEWMQANPGIGQNDIYYPDQLSWQEELWAKAEIYLLTKNSTLLGNIYSEIVSKNISDVSWKQPHLFAYAKLYKDESVPVSVKNWIKLKVENYVNELKNIVESSGYGCVIDKYNWNPGTNTKISNTAATFIYTYLITEDMFWLDLANQQLDYLLGRNSLNFSFVSGAGENSFGQPYHWITKTYGIVPPGLIGQGAAGSSLNENDGADRFVSELVAAEFPPAKVYVDTVDSRNSNEAGIYEVSSLAYVMGFLSLHNRDVNITHSVLLSQAKSKLRVRIKNNHIFCENAEGKTSLYLFDLSGQQIFNIHKLVNKSVPLVNYKKYVQKYPIIVYKIFDEGGRIKTGKLTAGFNESY